MFSNLLVAIVLGIGVAGWTYAQMQRRNGGLTDQSIKVAAVVFFITSFVAVTLLAIFL